MSIFTNHIVESDEILSQWYERSEDSDAPLWNGAWGRSDGWLYPRMNKAPHDIWDRGDYCTAIAAYNDWRPWRTYKMAKQYHVEEFSNIRIDKRHYLRAIQKAYDNGEIRAHMYKGLLYFCWRDVRSFHTMYEINLILKYCEKHKFHWDGPLE
jgi:hypothetical protein